MPTAIDRANAVAQVLVKDVTDPLLDDDTTHHLVRVLRVRDGEAISVSDGAGMWCIARAVVRSKSDLRLLSDSEVVTEPAPEPRLGVAFAPLRRTATNQLVQQCTEVGIDNLYPVITAFTNTDVDSLRTDRLEKIVTEAAMQSRRVWLPTVHPPTPWPNFIHQFPHVVRTDMVQGESVATSQSTLLAVGPEGGWSDAEREQWPRTFHLGPEVMRAETAAVVAAATLISAHRG